jgi:hypothetical protein
VEIRDDIVREGLSGWTNAQSTHEQLVAQYRAALADVNNAAVFGGDTPGQQFLASYLEGGGPAVLLFGPNGLGGILEALGTTGEQMGANLDAALSQEDANAAAVARSADPSTRA